MIISAGECLVDVLPDGRVVPGGGPMNAAVAAARLGAPVAFLGRISTDANGEAIRAHLEAAGVDLRLVQRGPEPTARAIVTTTPVQSFVFEGEGTADSCLEPIDLAVLDARPGLLHGGTLGIFRGTTADVLAGLCSTFDGIVSFDPNIRPQIIDEQRDTWWRYADVWLDRADVIRGSDEDFEWMGVTPAELLRRGASVVLRTLGPEGVEVYRSDGSTVTVPGRRVEVVDTVGAGDSFCGAMLVQLHERNAIGRGLDDLSIDEWADIARFAVAVSAVTVSRAGADPPYRRELGA